jgi:hypothetical protein
MNIAVDCDGTLYCFEKLAREILLKLALERGDKKYLRGAYAPWVEWRSPLDAAEKETWQEVIDIAHSPDMILAQAPYSDCIDILRKLSDNGAHLTYISNRNPNCAQATAEWLGKHNFPVNELICTLEDKKPFIKLCQYLIDDRPRGLCDFVYDFDWKKKYRGKDRIGFGLMTEYNRALSDIPNIYLAPPGSWRGIEYYLRKAGVL